jgi:hypothetical protein
MKRTAALLAATAIALASAARADWTLTAADFKDQPGLVVNEFSVKDGLSVSAPNGQLRKVPTKDVLALASDRKPAEPTSPWAVKLRNGDVLYGMPSEADENTLTFTLTEGVDVAVPVKNVATLAQRKAPAAAGSATRDVIRMANGDTLQGDFVGLKAGEVQARVNKADRTLKLDGVSGVTFAGVTPARSVPDLSARLTFAGGTVLTVNDLAWKLGDVTFKDPTGAERKVAADTVVSVDVLGGRAVFLTELDPVKDEQISTFSTKWPTQINKNVMGQPLRVAKQAFSRGIGVHTRSALVYEIDGTFDTLSLQAGVDDSAAPFGEANLTVVLDGKVLWEKKSLKAGQLTEPLKLPIKGGRKLELLADPADKMDVQGRVDWVNVALTR